MFIICKQKNRKYWTYRNQQCLGFQLSMSMNMKKKVMRSESLCVASFDEIVFHKDPSLDNLLLFQKKF